MKHLHLGVAYYAEQIPEDQWVLDAQLMRDMGGDIIRVGEFCWSRMQRADGTLTLDWLERLVDLFAEHGIKTMLCTPSATPPVWVVDRFDDLAVVLPDGRRGEFGGRRHYSVFHEGYRALCVGIANALADRFGQHEGVAGWQIDNEVGSYSMVDCSPPALRAFHKWCEATYSSVDEINRRWGLIFWNQEIERFDQLPAPSHMMTTRNPQYLLAYNRFCIDGHADFILTQAQAVRERAGEHQFVMNSCEESISRRTLTMQAERGVRAIDYGAVNNYPELLPEPGQSAMRLDRQRAINTPGCFLVPELQVGSGHTTTGGLIHAARRFMAFESLARGGRLIQWFHWLRFRTGCEWRLTAIVERDRVPRSVYRSVASIISDIRKVEPILRDAAVDADVQMLYSIDNALARDRSSEATFWLEIQLPDAAHLRMPLWERETRRAAYLPLSRYGLTVDFVLDDQPWSPDKPLIISDLDLCTPELIDKLRAYCESGGRAVVFPGAGERNADGAHVDAPPPGQLAELVGAVLKDYYPLEGAPGATFDPATGRMTTPVDAPERDTHAHVDVNGKAITVDIRHGEVLDACDADVIGRYTTGPCAGEAAMTLRPVGKGWIAYLGAVPIDDDQAMPLYHDLFPNLTTQVTPFRTVKLQTTGGRYAFYLNDAAAPCPLHVGVHDLITDRDVSELPAYGVVLVRREDVID